MDKASAYGAGDCRFESCRVHIIFQHGSMILACEGFQPKSLKLTMDDSGNQTCNRKCCLHIIREPPLLFFFERKNTSFV